MRFESPRSFITSGAVRVGVCGYRQPAHCAPLLLHPVILLTSGRSIGMSGIPLFAGYAPTRTAPLAAARVYSREIDVVERVAADLVPVSLHRR
jgi:hypothetical protein